MLTPNYNVLNNVRVATESLSDGDNGAVLTKPNICYLLSQTGDINMNEHPKKKYHFIYKITNNVNGKIYIGKHTTYNLNDNYMGSESYLSNAIKKYGIENFTKEILFLCEDEEDAYKLEKQIVTTEFVNRKDTYNITEGGWGWSSESLRRLWNTSDYRNKRSLLQSKIMKERLKNPKYKEIVVNNILNWVNSERGKNFAKNLANTILVPYSRSKEGRERASKWLKQWTSSEEGKLHCKSHGKEVFTNYNKSDKHRQIAILSNKTRIITQETKNKHSKNTKEFNRLNPDKAKEKQLLATLARYYNSIKYINDNKINEEIYENARLKSNLNSKSLPRWRSIKNKFLSVDDFIEKINKKYNLELYYEN